MLNSRRIKRQGSVVTGTQAVRSTASIFIRWTRGNSNSVNSYQSQGPDIHALQLVLNIVPSIEFIVHGNEYF